MSDSSLTKWQPSANNLAMLKIFQAADYDISVTAACEALGIARHSYYEWFDKPQFAQWWQDQAERFFTQQVGAVYARLLSGAKGAFDSQRARPMPAMVKLFLERFDKSYCPRSAKDVTSNQDVNINLKSDAALQELCQSVIARGAEDDDGKRAMAEQGDSERET